jgi:hypothetical protein
VPAPRHLCAGSAGPAPALNARPAPHPEGVDGSWLRSYVDRTFVRTRPPSERLRGVRGVSRECAAAPDGRTSAPEARRLDLVGHSRNACEEVDGRSHVESKC